MKNILNITIKKIALFLLLFFVIWAFCLFICLKYSKIVDPLSITINSLEKIDFNEVEIYRVAPRSGTFLIEKGNNNKCYYDKSYIKSLKIIMPEYIFNKIKNLEIYIGEKDFNFSKKQLLAEWENSREIKNDKKIIILKSPPNIRSKNSFIKIFSGIINWKGDFLILFINSIYALISIVIIIFIVILYKLIESKKNTLLRYYNFIVNSSVKKYKYIIALVLFIFIWGIILLFSGTIFSGYHFADDHEILRIKNDLVLSNNNVITTTFKWINNDIFNANRFRPFYFLDRVFRVFIFSNNFIALSIYNGILAIIVSFILFIFIKKIGFSFFESIIFSCLTLIGAQSCIWWRLGPNESIAMVMFSFSLIFLYLNIYSKKHNFIFEIIWILFVILVSLSKESFILFLPSLIILKIWLYKYKNNTNWINSIKKNIVPIIFILFILIFEILFIKLFVSLTWSHRKIGFEGFKFLEYINAIINFYFRGVVPLGIVLTVFYTISVFIIYKKNGKEELIPYFKKSLPAFILLFIIIIPQAMMYSNTNIHGRYLLPAIFGFTFFIIYNLGLIRKYKLFALNIFFVMFLFITIMINTMLTFNGAKKFTNKGKRNNNLFHSIKENTSENSLILIVADPIGNIEWAFSIKTYLNLVLKKDNLYVYSILNRNDYHDYYDEFIKAFNSFYKENILQNIDNKDLIDFIIIFQDLNKRYIEGTKDWFNKENYKYKNIDCFNVYYKDR